jgi:hypothetical protein
MQAHAADAGGHAGDSGTPIGGASFVFPPKVAATLNALKEISSRYSPRAPTLIGDTAKKPIESVLGYVRQNGIDFIDFTNEGIDEHHGRRTVHDHVTQAQLRQQIVNKKGFEISELAEFLRALRVRLVGLPRGASLVRRTAGTISINLQDEYLITFADPDTNPKITSLQYLRDPEGGD